MRWARRTAGPAARKAADWLRPRCDPSPAKQAECTRRTATAPRTRSRSSTGPCCRRCSSSRRSTRGSVLSHAPPVQVGAWAPAWTRSPTLAVPSPSVLGFPRSGGLGLLLVLLGPFLLLDARLVGHAGVASLLLREALG